MHLILGSASPARLQTLRAAGIDPEVIDSEVDESKERANTAAQLTAQLARIKGEAVLAKLADAGRLHDPAVVVACDSMLEIDGQLHGKPGSPEAAIIRWYRMRGREGVLNTGHYVAVLGEGEPESMVRVASTIVAFADLTDAEIAAYAATGEPQKVAGAFTIDGYGGPFVTRISGDPHNVIGISLPLVRQMLLDLGLPWHTLWAEQRPNPVWGAGASTRPPKTELTTPQP